MRGKELYTGWSSTVGLASHWQPREDEPQYSYQKYSEEQRATNRPGTWGLPRQLCRRSTTTARESTQREGGGTSQMRAARSTTEPRKKRGKSSLGRATSRSQERQGRGDKEKRWKMDPATGGAQATHRGLETLRGNSSKGTSGECREKRYNYRSLPRS